MKKYFKMFLNKTVHWNVKNQITLFINISIAKHASIPIKGSYTNFSMNNLTYKNAYWFKKIL